MKLQLLHGLGAFWLSEGLDASGRPIAEAVAIFVPLLSWLSSPPSSSLPLSFDQASLPCCLPYDIITQRYRRPSKKPLGWTLRPFVCEFQRGINMEREKKKSSVTPPFNIHIHYSPLPADGWFIRPIQNYIHTPTPSIPHTGVCRGPPLWPQRLMTCLKSFFHFQSLILFFHIFFIFLIHLLMQQARMCSRSSRSLKENTCNATPPRAYFGLSSPAFSKYLQLVSTISNPIKVLCPLKEPICV